MNSAILQPISDLRSSLAGKLPSLPLLLHLRQGPDVARSAANATYRLLLPSITQAFPETTRELAYSLKPNNGKSCQDFFRSAQGIILLHLVEEYQGQKRNIKLNDLEVLSGYSQTVISQQIGRLKNWGLDTAKNASECGRGFRIVGSVEQGWCLEQILK